MKNIKNEFSVKSDRDLLWFFKKLAKSVKNHVLKAAAFDFTPKSHFSGSYGANYSFSQSDGANSWFFVKLRGKLTFFLKLRCKMLFFVELRGELHAEVLSTRGSQKNTETFRDTVKKDL